MELCCPLNPLSTLPRLKRSDLNSSLPLLPRRAPSLTLARHVTSQSKPGFCNTLLVRAKTSEEASTVVDEQRKTIDEGLEVGVSSEEAPNDGEQDEVADLLNKLDIKIDSDSTLSIVTYGVGALLAVWLSSAIVSAVDSLPLFPKLMEVVGLGFSVWFSYRYLIFKKTRDELVVKLEALKEQIIGPSDN